MIYKTEQEEFWAGEFGSSYIQRNQGEHAIAANLSFFLAIFKKTSAIESVTEFGANIGLNLQALKLLYPEQIQYGIEINPDAIQELKKIVTQENIFEGSIFDFKPIVQTTLSLIKGVLIHINPDKLNDVYDLLYQTSKQYILICEYYNPTPVEVNYRGHNGKLFKRDFAGEFMDKFSNVKLIDYGFVYKRDLSFPQDDITWFLMEK